MKRTIDRVLRCADTAIEIFRDFIGECHDSDLVRDGFSLMNSVSYAKQVCVVYYRHWMYCFDKAQIQRYHHIMSFDEIALYEKYIHTYPVRSVSNDDLPF